MAGLGTLVAQLVLDQNNFSRGFQVATGIMTGFSSAAAGWLSRSSATASKGIAAANQAAIATTKAAAAPARNLQQTNAASGRSFQNLSASAGWSWLTMRGAQSRMAADANRYHQQMMQQHRLQRVQLAGTSAAHIGLGVVIGSVTNRLIHMAASAPGMGIKLAADAEQAKIGFEVMLGSAEKATELLSQLKDYAAKSPFSLEGTNEAALQLLNYGIQAQDIMPTMRMLGDVAKGNMQQFNGLAYALGQVAAKGRLQGQEKNQLINAGFNPIFRTPCSIANQRAKPIRFWMVETLVSQADVEASGRGIAPG